MYKVAVLAQYNVFSRWRKIKNVTCRLGVAKAITDFPAPVKNAVTLTYTSIHTPQAKAMVTMCVIGIIFELFLAFMFLFKSDKQVIKAASIKASLMIFLGACLTLSSVIMRVTGRTSNGWFQCWGTYYAFATGFGLVLGALALKSYRISYIFNSAKKTMDATFTDAKLMASLLGIVLIEIGLCIALEFGLEDSSTVRYLNLPGFNTTIEQHDCPTSHKGGEVTLYIWNVLLIIVAAYYAFKTRNVVAAFNENVFTSSAILLISVVTIVIVPVLQLITSSVAIFMLIALGTIIATLLSTAIFAVPKVLMALELINVENVTETLYKSAMLGGHAATGMGKGGGIHQNRTKTSTPDAMSATSSDTRASTAKLPGNRMMPVGSVPIGSSIAQRQDSFDTARKGDSDSDV
ncbi:hypothetical protein HDV00_002302 [Rhizophlyctis rosea]|nr:hypothetical protein HDV00_002302 [Rhizophlyctis rosea]